LILYADTSALLKLILLEPGTAEMHESVRGADLVTAAAIGYPELRAALAAAFRGNRVPVADQPGRLQHLEQVWSQVVEIPLDRPLLRRAGYLAQDLALRGYDAVHLAALKRVGGIDEVTLACWDGDLRGAAERLGYSVIPV
jgi:predicted nucleic acid-binding protein